VLGIIGLRGSCVIANVASPIGAVAHDRRQQHATRIVWQRHDMPVAQRGDQRVRGAQVDADRDAPRMGIGALAGFR
jgi:hypothetical protein